MTDGGKKRRGSGSQRGGSSQSQAVERRILPTSKSVTNHSQPSSRPAAPCVPIPGASHTAELNLELAHQRTKAGKKQHSSTQPGSRSVAENKSSRLLQSTATSVQRPACMRSGTEPQELRPSCDQVFQEEPYASHHTHPHYFLFPAGSTNTPPSPSH